MGQTIHSDYCQMSDLDGWL